MFSPFWFRCPERPPLQQEISAAAAVSTVAPQPLVFASPAAGPVFAAAAAAVPAVAVGSLAVADVAAGREWGADAVGLLAVAAAAAGEAAADVDWAAPGDDGAVVGSQTCKKFNSLKDRLMRWLEPVPMR